MASVTESTTKTPKPRRFSLVTALMYVTLIAYAAVSVLPFVFMFLASLTTLNEVQSTQPWPKDLRFGSDITPCILYTKDTFVNSQGDTVTENRWVTNISEEAASTQRYGTSTFSDKYIERDELFAIPFFTNYCAAWTSGNLGKHMWNTVKLVIIQVTGTIVFATLTAYAFARMEFVGKEVLFAIMLATLMIPGIVTNLPNFLLVNEIGKLTAEWGQAIFTDRLGLIEGGADAPCNGWKNCWLNNWPALTIPFMAPAISIFLLRQHFATLPSELWDAARIDGAGHMRFLLTIVIPLSKAALLVILLFAFISAWNELAWALLVTSGDEWRPIAVGLQSFLDDEASLGHLRMAGSVITIVPILLLYALTQRQFIEGLSQSGLKG